MSLLPEIREELRAAVARQAAAGPPAPRPRRWWSATGGAVALALPLALVVVTAAVFFSLHGSGQSPASSGQREANSERPLLRVLGVLRRPQTKADLPPALLRALKQRPRFGALDARQGQPDLAGVRLAAVTPAGEQVFLVPYRPPTARAISAAISKLPASRRAAIGARWRAQAPHSDTLGIQLTYHGQPGGGGSDATAATLEQQGTATWSGGYKGDTTEVILVVPDPVAEVALLVPRKYGSSDITQFTAPVHNNVAVLYVHGAVDDPVTNMIWYGPTGRIIRRVSQGSSSACGGPHFLFGRPPRSITAVLGSLSKPASPGQRIPQSAMQTPFNVKGTGPGRVQGSGIYVRYSRTGQLNGVRYYLIPIQNIGGCQPGVALITRYGQGLGASFFSMSKIRNYLDTGSGGQDHYTITPLVVPSGIASVTAHYPAQNQPGRVPRPITTTKPVTNNLVIFVFHGAWDPPTLTYHTQTGATIRPYLKR